MYDQEIPQPKIADQPMAPRGRDTEHRQQHHNQDKATSYLPQQDDC